MTAFLKHRLPELTIALLAFGLSYCFFTPTTDDYGAFSYFNLPNGQFSNYPHVEYYYLGLVGLSSVYKILYPLVPGINWVGVSFLGFQFLSLYWLLRSIKTVLLASHSNTNFIVAVQLLFTLFFAENISSISHTRFSLIFCGISLFNLVFTKNIGRGSVGVNTLVFILGFLIRPESGLGMVLLVSVGYLISTFNIIHLTKRIFLPALFTISTFSFFAFDWAHSDMYVKKVEPEIEYKIMDKRMVPLSEMKTAADSVKYEAARQGMWFDTHTLSPEYLRSLLLPGINLSAEHAEKVFLHVLAFYSYYLFIACFVVALVLVGLFCPGHRQAVLKIILFQIATFLVIYAVDFNGRLVGERHFLNLQLVALIISTYYLVRDTAALPKFNKLLLAMALLVTTAGTVLTLSNYKATNRQMAADIECYEACMQEFENTYTNRLVVATLSNIYIFNRKFSVYTTNYTKNKYIMFDVFTYSLAPDYLNYLGSQCECNPSRPVEFYKWLANNHALYMGEPGRYDLTERYMNTVHHQKLKFVPSAKFSKPSCIESTDMSEFEFCDVTIEE